MKKFIKRSIIGIVIIICGIMLLVGLHNFTYSSGSRTGDLVKLSGAKGWIWKSIEGELQMGDQKGTLWLIQAKASLWQFSVLDKELYTDQLRRMEGMNITLCYTQYPFRWFTRAKTEYIVYAVGTCNED